MRALHALERFRQSGTHLGLVMDEFGGIDGLVSLIDILEAIVGDIPTIDELAEPPVVERDDGSWLVEGLLAIDEFKLAFELGELPGEGSYQTVGGFAVYMIGDTPVAGDDFSLGDFRFEVVDMDRHRVDKVLVERVGPVA
jgi:putative hemolysin